MFRPQFSAPIPDGIRNFNFELAVFTSEAERVYSERVMQHALDFLTLANIEWMRAHPGRIQPIYKCGGNRLVDVPRGGTFRTISKQQDISIGALRSANAALAKRVTEDADIGGERVTIPGLVYTREPGGADERWQDCFSSWLRRRVDCEDASCWLAAELRVNGIPARAFPTGRRLNTGGVMYHIRVRTADKILDPSRVLGMATPEEGEFGHRPNPGAPLAMEQII